MLDIYQGVVIMAQGRILCSLDYIIVKWIGDGRYIDQNDLAVLFRVGGNKAFRQWIIQRMDGFHDLFCGAALDCGCIVDKA